MREEKDAYNVLMVNLKNDTALKAAPFFILHISTNIRFKTVKFHASEYNN
jgi:hypothetical protein